MTRKNTTFSKGHPVWANACVGNNGSAGTWEYATGFAQAANILIDMALDNRGLEYSVDALIYPICFNMRHAVELRLKEALSELILMNQSKNQTLKFNLASSHDIANIWEFFSDKSESFDDRYKTINARLECKIIDIAEIDPTGQTFRYPNDTENQKHLVDVGLINLVNLKASFSQLQADLNELCNLNRYLSDEYCLDTFTNKLSRKNIFEIALKLPMRDTWSENSFGAAKTEIKEHFNIGSRDLSAAIKIIETHFEFAPLIGLSVAILGVSDRDISEFVINWLKFHELASDFDPIDIDCDDFKINEDVDSMIQSWHQDAAVRQEVWLELGSKLTPEFLSGISALYYFSSRLDFSERYIRIYSADLKMYLVAFKQSSNDGLKQQFFEYFEKGDVIPNLLKSLYFLEKMELAEKLVSAHNLDGKFSWLGDARSRILFQKPKYCGYDLARH